MAQLPATMCGRSPSAKTTTASASTAGSSGTCPTSASTSCRAGRGPDSCGSTASARRPATGCETGQVLRVPPAEAAPAEGPGARPKRIVEPLTEDEAEFVRDMVHGQGPRLVRAQQAAGTGDAGRDQDGPASRPAARRAGRRGRAAAQAGPPARQGHQRRPAGRALGAGGGSFRQGLFRPHRAQGLLGADRRRAVGRGRADRRAARQAARDRRREDACRRGKWPAGARRAIG